MAQHGSRSESTARADKKPSSDCRRLTLSRPNHFGLSCWASRANRSSITHVKTDLCRVSAETLGVLMGDVVCDAGPATLLLYTQSPSRSNGVFSPLRCSALGDCSNYYAPEPNAVQERSGRRERRISWWRRQYPTLPTCCNRCIMVLSSIDSPAFNGRTQYGWLVGSGWVTCRWADDYGEENERHGHLCLLRTPRTLNQGPHPAQESIPQTAAIQSYHSPLLHRLQPSRSEGR